MQTILPPKLQKGDTVGIISPSQSLRKRQETFNSAMQNFSEALEVNIVIAPHARGQQYYSSGTIKERLDDFHQMIANPEIKAIIFSVGGNTAIDLVEGLNYDLIKQHPKIITGISDATTLLNPIFVKTGLITFLGLEFTDFGRASMQYEIEQIKRTFFAGETGAIEANPNWHEFQNNPTTYAGWQAIKEGVVTGRIVGGNLTCFEQLYGSAYFADLQNTILVLESYRLHKKTNPSNAGCNAVKRYL